MSQDKQTYTRASHAALIGFATQLALCAIVAILGVYTESRAAVAITWYALAGLPIWGAIWILFNQHRLERIESLEAARLAGSDARSAAIFNEAGASLDQSRRRLENIQKWGLPTVSGFTAFYLIAMGALLGIRNLRAYQLTDLAEQPAAEDINGGLIMLLLFVFGLSGFLVARYVAGMTRVKEWQGLRGGASFLIGNVFLGIAPVLFGFILLWLNIPTLLAILAIALPAVMVLLGLEIVLGFVLGMYRPRKADEFIRPAFDSRVLGWLTRPESMGKIFSETLNYQFGFEISKSWFAKLLGKALIPLAMACLLVVVAMSSLVIVEPHQEAVVTYNGAFIRIAEPGLSFKAPWPLGRTTLYDVNRVQSLKLGSRSHMEDIEPGPILWANDHVREGTSEVFLVTAPTASPRQAGEQADDDETVLGEMLGADIDVKYRITSLREYLGVDDPRNSVEEPEVLLEAIAQQQVSLYFATHDSESLLTSARLTAGEEIKANIQAELDRYRLGIEVVFVSVSGVHPPKDVAPQYHERVNALQEKETAIEGANQTAGVMLSTLAGSQDTAQQIADSIEQLSAFKALLLEARDMDSPDAQAVADLELQIAAQQAQIELQLTSAGGQVGTMLLEARAYRWSIALDAQGRALQREAEIAAYHNAPLYYPMRRYLEMTASALEDRPKTFIVPGPNAHPPVIELNMPQIGVPGVGGP